MGVKIDLLEVLRQKDRLSDVNTEMVSTLGIEDVDQKYIEDTLKSIK